MSEVVLFLMKCIYFMLPAYFANMAPVIVKRVNFLVYPVDLGREMNKKPLFGRNKTFRGLFFGILFAVIVSYLQFVGYKTGFSSGISFFSYNNWLVFGFLMGTGALAGDLVKSFFKRRIGINPGSKFIPFDQSDFVIGASIFIMPVFALTWNIFLTSLVLSFVLDILVNHAAFYLKIRSEKW